MKNLNLFRKSARGSEGSTLASAVVRPSFDRRSTVVKHLAFMLLFLLGSLNVWGAEETWSWTLATGNNLGTANSVTTNPSGSKTLTGKVGSNDVAKSWDFAMVSGTSKYYLNGAQIGSGTNYCTSVTLSTSAFTQTIKNVKVTSKCGSSATATISISVGGTTYVNAQSLSTTETVYGLTSNTGTATGDIVITLSQPSTHKALYIYKVDVIYEAGGASLESIEITGTPEMTSYEQGQSFDPKGLTVTAHYDDATNADVTDDVEWSFDPASFSVVGTNKSVTATATYNDKEDTKIIDNITVTEHVVTPGTYDITFNNAFFGTTGLTGSLSGTNLKDYSGSKDDITVEYKKGTGSNMYLKDSEIRLYSGNTLVITAPSGYNITSVTGLKSTMTANEGTITDTEWSGESNSVTFSHNGTKGNSSLATISVTYAAVDMSKPATPEFSVAAGIYTEAQSIELSCTTDGATIYYTTDGSTPDNTSTEYTGSAISLSERGTYTIKAIAIKGEDASAVASATYTINLPYIFASVSELFTYLDENSLTTLNDVTVTGYVSEIVTEYSTQYSNISFNISDDGSTTAAQLQSYRGKGTDASSIEVGDKVTISGNYKVHNSTKELDQNNTITNRIAKGAVTSVAVSGTATKTTYSANETFETAGLVVTATYANGFSAVVTEGITWGDDLTDHKVAATGTVQVTATVGGVTSAAYDVAIVVSTKTLVSIAAGTDSYTVYKGQALPKPVITATYTEGDADVSAEAVYDTESEFDNTTVGTYNITVSYTFGGATKTTTYTVTVKDYANDAAHPYTVAEALNIIVNAIGSTKSTSDIYVQGKVSKLGGNISSGKWGYWISEDGSETNQLQIYNGYYLNGENFTNDTKLQHQDEVIVKGKVIYYDNKTPEFATGESQLYSLARTPNFEVEAVTGFEVGSANLAVADLTITQDGEGAVTLAGSDDEEVVTIEGGKLHAVAPGTATITANLVADGIYKAATYEFSVTVIAAQVKYAITFDGNGADGGEAPEAIADKAAGAEVTLPANSYTKTGHTFNGWKVINNTTSEEVEVVAGVFTMPASAVTIQAKWAEISVWATTYTSNVTLTAGTGAQAAKVRFTADGEQYDAVKAGTGKAGGSITVTVPAQATKLHLHVAGWTGENPVISITAPDGVTVSPASISATADAGISSNSPFTLENDPVGQYFALSLSGNTEEIELTFAVDGGNKRFVLFGVNQEGGVVPVLDHIEIAGDLTNKSGYKAGDALDLDGLTVSATYTLGGTPQTPVDITDDVALEWSYDPLVENQTSVTITASYKGQTDDITINDLEPVASADPKIYVDKLSVNFGTVAPNASVDAQTITVTLTNVANATATLGGTNPEAFSINPASPAALTESGDITISVVSTANVGTYSATITISDDAEAATSKVVNLSLTVEDVETAVSTTSKWVAATAADLVDGAEVLIVGVNNTEYYAMGVQNSNNRAAVAASVDGEGVLTPGEGTMSFILVAQGDGTFALRTSNSKYLYAAASGSNHLKTQAEVNDDAKWTLTATSAKAESSTNRNVMQFNSGSSIFSCYGSASQKPIAFYIPQVVEPVYETVRSGLEVNRHYTVCLPKNITHIKGATFWNLQYKNAGNTEVYLVEETAPEAGKPYIIQATDTKLEVVYGEEIAANPVENGALRGTFTGINETDFAALEGTVYLLINNAIRPRTAGNYLDANRAYVRYDLLTVPQTQNFAPGKRVRAMPMAPQVATGVDQVPSDQVPNTKVLINGQLYIMYNGTMYNVQGQLVK